ncbi:MAG: glycosyl hydrolase family 3 [Cellulosilyticum sp.]|nr:glycosyl hydrolase family 3 [Cellulosilyticum sp.]
MSIDFKAQPFNLSDSDIKWVEETFNSLSLDEKIGQIFVDMLWGDTEETIKEKITKYHQGGFRYNNLSKEDLYKQNATIQNTSKVPALIAANVEGGGNGAVKGGTQVGNPVAIGATQNKENAYYLGYHGCKEAAAVGCNWTFAPIVDVNYNWRNCVVSDRCFSSDPEVVLEMAKEYHRGAKDAGVACCMKHFPGDGLDERDQHIVTTVNDQTVEEWDASFGKIYKGLIDQGMESIMIGHIQLPEYSRKLRPGIKDQDIMPATMAPELLKDLLRGQLGFNGLIITDATHMVGLTSKAKRSEFVPGVIEAGCDMILYYRDKEEDINFFKKGLETGLVSQERFDEAVKRVLAMKAMLKLHEKATNGTLMPSEENLSIIGCEEHIKKANEIIDESITLVKNTKAQLPLTPETHKRIMLYSIDTTDFRSKQMGAGDSIEELFKAELEKAGFEVFTFDPNTEMNGKQLLAATPITEYVAKYDAVMLVCNVAGFSQSNERRLHWSMPMGPDIPWYVTELPTVCISVANPFHLIDVPMVPTYINTYNTTKDAIRQVVEKITGKSEFKGVSPVDAFCGAWDTRL